MKRLRSLRDWLAGDVPLWVAIIGVIVVMTLWGIAYMTRLFG